jgi:hypothetical protein
MAMSLFPVVMTPCCPLISPPSHFLKVALRNSSIDLCQISETWQDINKKDHNDKIEWLEKQFGYKWYSFVRPKYRDDGSLTGGGGCAVLVNTRNWLSIHLDCMQLYYNV